MNAIRPFTSAALISLFTIHAVWADSGDINSYSLQKASVYYQSDASSPTFINAGGGVIIFETSAGSVAPTPTIQFPDMTVYSLTDYGTLWDYGQGPFGSPAALDAAFPSGGYLFTIPTTSGAATTYTPTLTMVPTVTAIPTITNTSWS